MEDQKTKATETLPADYVVLSMGVRPINQLAAQLNDQVKVVTVGDAVKSGTIANACHNAHEAVMAIK